MVRTKLVGERLHYGTLTGSVVKRWDVSGLQNKLVDDNDNEIALGRCLKRVEDKLQANWTTESDIEGKLNILQNTLCEGGRL